MHSLTMDQRCPQQVGVSVSYRVIVILTFVGLHYNNCITMLGMEMQN